MTIRKKKATKQIVIDLTGPQGNAFFILAQVKPLAKMLGLEDKAICDEMTSGDYENLIKVFDKYFGKYVILER
tara:strand:- start:247 stop:465 length:219 start_codon:yes stop_codon:yes gene_type:complete